MENTVDAEKIKLMSEDLRIEVDVLKNYFKVSPVISNLDNLEDACKLFEAALEGSPQKKSLLKKVNQLIRKKIASSRCIDDLRNFYEFIPNEVEMKKEVTEKWDEFSKMEINSSSSVDQIILTFLSARKEQEIIKLVVAKWIEIINNSIPSITCFKYALDLFKDKIPFRYLDRVSFYYEDKSYPVVYKKLLQLSSSVEEIEIVFKGVHHAYEQGKAIARWVELISNVDEADYLVQNILSKNSDHLPRVRNKWSQFSEKEIESATTLEETFTAYERCWHDSDAKTPAIKKMNNLCLDQINDSSGYEDLIKLLKFCFKGTSSEIKLAKKLLNITKSLEENQKLYNILYGRYQDSDSFSVNSSWSQWETKSLEAINLALTFSELKKLSASIPSGSEKVQTVFINKLIDLALYLEQAASARDVLFNMFSKNHPWLKKEHPEFLELADKKITDLSVRAIKRTSKLNEMLLIKSFIYNRRVEYVVGINHVKDLFFKKLESLIKKRLKSANNKEELKELLEASFSESDSRRLILKKLSYFY